ncbi:hypothetical protein OS493_032279 [Desmophyllum pertusum]|uniref:Secreted protein n=1 Tax=Desmophyllum pertusum TaxID=174260 RepID=A0A9W9Z820_9CNID|nr:hypothetical protein OS493_032279 [Desmophyllum pertusum]
MAGRMLVKLLFLMMFYELLLFSASEAWWSCDSKNPPGTWENTWQESFTFTCPRLRKWGPGGVGRVCTETAKKIASTGFRCAHSPLPYGSKCAWISYVNDYDQKVDFTCPNDGLLTGVKSEYSKVHRDRK